MSSLNRVVYRYYSYALGCGCCSDAESVVEYTTQEAEDLWAELENFPVCSDKEELIEALSEYGFTCDENTGFGPNHYY